MTEARGGRTREENMPGMRFLGLIFALALILDKGRTESAILDVGQDRDPTASENSFSIQIPLGSGNVIQADNQITPTAERRLSLEDFFLNKNQQEQPQPAAEQQAPVAQFQVQQPDPNSMFLVRDTQFPSPTGGLISRLLVARRMLRLRRIARRLSLIPRLFGLGLRQTLGRSALSGNQSPLSIFSNRVGESYDPREFVFGDKGFTYQNNITSDAQQHGGSSTDQAQQQTRGYSVETDPYYGGVLDSNYDSQDDSSNYDSQELNELKKQQEILNSLTDEQQILLLEQLQSYQQQLNHLQQQLNNPNNNNVHLQNHQNQEQVFDHKFKHYQQPQQVHQIAQPNQYQQIQQNTPVQQNQHQQSQALTNHQLEQLHLLQQQLAREQQLQQQLQQLQLTQQAQNIKQHQNQQNIAAVEQESNYQHQTNPNLAHSNVDHQTSNNVGDRTESSQYISPIGIGGSAGGKAIGVGINVGIKPPAVDVQITKPVAPVIKPFPPIVNPIVHKPIHAAPVVEPLVPLGIFPKPILNLKGRLFFGAEMGKEVGIKTGAGR